VVIDDCLGTNWTILCKSGIQLQAKLERSGDSEGFSDTSPRQQLAHAQWETESKVDRTHGKWSGVLGTLNTDGRLLGVYVSLLFPHSRLAGTCTSTVWAYGMRKRVEREQVRWFYVYETTYSFMFLRSNLRLHPYQPAHSASTFRA
jgi:hypothetical protein